MRYYTSCTRQLNSLLVTVDGVEHLAIANDGPYSIGFDDIRVLLGE